MKKVALVTGGARGIGFAICKALAGDGFEIAILDVRPPGDVKENMEALRAAGCRPLYIAGSVADGADRGRCVDQVLAEFGRIDVLVSNAGVAPKVRADLLEMTQESYDFVMDVNLKGALFFTQLVAKKMMANPPAAGKGTVIFISSMSARVASISRGEYCVSKAGVSMLAKLFADRLAPEGIHVYEIRPGIIETEMTKTVKQKYDAFFESGACPIARWGQPEDVAEVVGLLCGRRLPYSTGEVINVDGGYHIQRL